MEILVPVKQVPDLVEELEIDESGRALDRSLLRFKLNEFDEHALEEAILLKEKHGAKVTVLLLDTGDVDETLYTCLAKGADRAIKVTGSFEEGVDSHHAARILSKLLASIAYDLILTGVQAADDRDGQVGPLLASYLGLPHVSVVSGVELAADGKSVAVKQEYSGGVMAEFEVSLPTLLGVQAAQQAPRYAPVSKVRQIMKTMKLEEAAAPEVEPEGGSLVKRLFKPEATGCAEIIEGNAEEVASKLLALLAQKGFVKG
jgi:electron transfer flavoprotein beta subunit